MPTAMNHAPQPLDLRAELFRLFGYDRFQGKQEEVISCAIKGIDTIAVMPTGAGKSLCYQLPAMLLPGTTLVISPLIALMKDQYDNLPREVYERTTIINSTLDAEELSQRMREIIAGKYKLVYCAPERLRQQAFTEALRRARISMLVVDEAHCVSMWGHDFRPDYLFISKCLPQLEHPTLMALTATATPQMREEIGKQLGRRFKPVVASVLRPNLYYEVEELADKEQKLQRLLEICKREHGAGVVYARSRDTCEQVAAMLRRSGVNAGYYHAGMEPEVRARAQEQFMLDNTRVIVATIAFGMGVDKSNVRFIVHFSPPDSLEGYVQESGRAGRDGRPARCVLLMTPADKANLSRWKREEQMKLGPLRAIYREIARQMPVGRAEFVRFDEIERKAGSGAQVDGTMARVGMSMLERAGLIVRHADAPKGMSLTLTPEGSNSKDREFAEFVNVASLTQGQAARRDTVALADALGATAPEIERKVLKWVENGWLLARGERRDPVIERLKAPAGTAEAMPRLLDEQDRAQQRQIDQIVQYAHADRCRHQFLAAHLGEQIEECGSSCDYCSPPPDRPVGGAQQVADLPDNPGQVIVDCLLSFPFQPGKPSLVKALTGSAASNVTAGRVKVFGALAGATPSAVERAIDDLVDAGYLEFYESRDGFRLLNVTPKGLAGVPRGAISLKQKKAPKQRARPQDRQAERTPYGRSARMDRERGKQALQQEVEREPTVEEADLFERLRQWRRVVANRLNLPPYIIFHDKTLWALARARPQSEDALRAVKGVGQNQVDKYGAELLQVLTAHREGDSEQ